MAGVTVKVEGGEELVAKLKELEQTVAGQALLEAARAGAEIVRDDAKTRAPVRTGNLRDHIEAGKPRLTKDGVEIDVGPTKEAWYGGFVERGTSRMRAKPYLLPALKSRKDDVARAMADILRKAIEGVSK